MVELDRPKTKEFEICRPSLLPGMLKCLAENQDAPIKDGLRIFEISDVILPSDDTETFARNERRLAAMYTGPTGSGLEIVHGGSLLQAALLCCLLLCSALL